MDKILITGANGYIGKSLATYLKDKFEVTTISRIDVDLLNRDAVNAYFQNKYFDSVIHCAIVGGSRLKKDTMNVLDENLIMYYNLLSNKKHFGKFIQFGSGAEDTARDTPYGLSKYVIRQSIETHQNFYDVRIYAVFDENELETRFIKANLLRYINKQPIQIHSNKIMSFFYMKDLVKLIEHILTTTPSILTKYNYAAYTDIYSLGDIANIINKLDTHKVPILIGKGNQPDYYSKISADYSLDYIGLREGIKETYTRLL